MDEQEHEVYGGEIPGDDGDMEADLDSLSSRHEDDQGYDDQNSKELDDMKKRLKEIEEEAGALREMQAKVEKEMGAVQDMDFSGVDVMDIIANVEEEEVVPEEVPPFQRVGQQAEEALPVTPRMSASTDIPSSSRTASDLHQPSRKRKTIEARSEGDISPVVALDPETLEASDISLREIKVINTPVTYFDEGVFGKSDLQLDLYQHFGSDKERHRVQTICKEKCLTHGELAAKRLFEVVSLIREGEIANRAYRQRTQDVEISLGQYEKAINKKDKIIYNLRIKNTDLGTELLDRTEKLKNAGNVALEQKIIAEEAVLRAEQAEKQLAQFKEEYEKMKEETISLRDLVAKLKEDCIKGYREGVSWVMGSLKTQAAKMNLSSTFLSIVRAMQTPEASGRTENVNPSDRVDQERAVTSSSKDQSTLKD